MNLDFFGLNRRPFAMTADPDSMVWTSQYKAAYQRLLHRLISERGIAVLVGDIGCGKTTFVQALSRSTKFEASHSAVLISRELNSEDEVYGQILACLSTPQTDISTDDLPGLVAKNLLGITNKGLAPVIIVDEAHALKGGAAEALVRIAQGELADAPPVSLVLVGHPELVGVLTRTDLKPLQASLSNRIHIGCLSAEEVPTFIDGRLRMAGFEGDGIFTPEAIIAIGEFSGGAPRMVNKICDMSLFLAAKEQQRIIDRSFVQGVVDHFKPIGGSPSASNQNRPAIGAGRGNDLSSGTGAHPVFTHAHGSKKPAARLTQKAPVAGEIDAGTDADKPDTVEISDATRLSATAGALPGNRSKGTGARGRASRVVWGTMAAATCTIAGLLVLNFLDVPVRDLGSNSAQHIPDAQNATPAPVHASVSASLTPSQTERVKVAENELATVRRTLAAAKAEKQMLEETLIDIRNDVGTAKSELIAETSRSDDVERQISELQIELKNLQSQTGAQRTLLDRLKEETEHVKGRLAALHAEDPFLRHAARDSEIVARADIGLDWSSTVLSSFGEPSSTERQAPLELEPVVADDNDPAKFFVAAIDSVHPEDVAISYARAAMRGHARSALYLGQLFDTGDGLIFDSDIARRWYQVAKDTQLLHQPELATDDIAPDHQTVALIASFASEGLAEFIWHGRAGSFTVELANSDHDIVARAHTPLTAINLKIPHGITHWRVATDGGRTSEWAGLTSAK